jgi:hypothetical protein
MNYNFYGILFKYIGRIYKYSLLVPHISALTLALTLALSILGGGNILIDSGCICSKEDVIKGLGNILAGISILLAFLALVIQGIDFKKLNDGFSDRILLKRLENSYQMKISSIIKNTIFSMMLTSILIAIIIIILLFTNFPASISILIFLIILIACYLTINILFAVIFWSFSIRSTDNR